MKMDKNENRLDVVSVSFELSLSQNVEKVKNEELNVKASAMAGNRKCRLQTGSKRT